MPEISRNRQNARYAEDVVNVKDFGAVGDGVTDDTAAIQDALDSGASVITVPHGLYIFTTLILPSNTTFKGLGGTLKLADNTCIDSGTSYYPIQNGTNDNVTYDSLVIDGNKANNTLFTVADAITCSGDRSRVVGCKITNPPDSGIMFSGVSNGRCEGNYVEGATDVGIYVNDSLGVATDMFESVIANNVVKDCTAAGISIKRYASKIIVTGNSINTANVGINTEEFFAAPSSKVASEGVSITNNQVRNIQGKGIFLQNAQSSLVSGNRVEDTDNHCIDLSGVESCVVTGNYLSPSQSTGNTVYGIILREREDIVCRNNVISNNVIKDCIGTSVRLEDATTSSGDNHEGNIINGNIIKTTVGGVSALRVQATWQSNVITDNVIDTNNTNAIEVFVGSNFNTIRDNKLVNGTISGNITATNFTVVGTRGLMTDYIGTAAPASGTFSQGDVVYNSSPAVDGSNLIIFGWICVSGGSPGTWSTMRVSAVSPAT